MSMCRRFEGAPVRRLIVSVPVETVREVDDLITGRWYLTHPARGCRAEFVRLAIAEKLERDRTALASVPDDSYSDTDTDTRAREGNATTT